MDWKDKVIFARDIDETGSMHVCSKEDDGAIPFVSIDVLDSALGSGDDEAIKILDWLSEYL